MSGNVDLLFAEQQIEDLKKEIRYHRSATLTLLLDLKVMIEEDDIEGALQYLEDLTTDD